MSKQKFLTKRPMVLMSSVRMPTRDILLWREAAALEGISASEFLRRAVRQEATRALTNARRGDEGPRAA
jgi:hypothetical protein